MLCGCAIVCTNIGGYTVVAKDNYTALLAEVGNYHQLANNITKLIENDNLRYEIAKNGHNLIKNYTWENAFNKLLNLPKSIKLTSVH